MNMYFRARNLWAILGMSAAAVMSQGAVAATPPTVNSIPISVDIDDFRLHYLNLRQLGVVAGTAPLIVDNVDFLVNGAPHRLIVAREHPNFNNGTGHVCVVIENLDFGSSANDTYALQFTLSSPRPGQAISAVVPIVVQAGTEVSSEDPLCNDTNATPVTGIVDQSFADTDGEAGEDVSLNAAASDADIDNVLSYQWYSNDELIGNAAILNTRLPDGVTGITLVVTDDSGDQGTDTIIANIGVTVEAATVTANAGPDRTVNDTDGARGETVTLDASASQGEFDDYQWLLGNTELGTGVTLEAQLPDGVNTVTLVATVFQGEGSLSVRDTVDITVNAPAAATANAGADRTVADSDGQPGETVTLDGSASTTPAGTITAYEWYLSNPESQSRDLLGSGVTLTTSLPDGVNTVILDVTNNAGITSSDSVEISIDAPPERTILSELPNLTPNQQRMASALDDICGRVLGLDDPGEEGTDTGAAKSAANQKVRALATEAEQSDLVSKCRGLLFNNTAANQVEALDELNGEDFAVARTQTLLFANFQYAGILDRLMALRGGARGLSLAGLNIMIDGKAVPLATLQKMAAGLLGGGAASDADEVGGLLNDKWGMWMRGNYSTGEKDASASSPSFDANQFAVIGGLDYRLSEKAVVGLSMAYGDSSVEFNPRSEGALDTTSWAVSAYGSMYAAKNFYFDAIMNVADSDYAADRNITYVDGQGLVNADAHGDTGGMTLSGGLSLGYDFLVKGLTISPNIGVFYIDATIDSFAESGAGGLNLLYDKQNFKSLTSNLGLRATYAWNLSWGVLLPHLRVDYVREFEDDVDVFGVRFAADPNAGSTPPILVETENPDTSYWRLAGGLSAQFKLGFSGYVEYQRLQSFEDISFQDISVGLRMQKSF